MVQAFGSPDDCILEGNAGVDALIGGFGGDRLFCGASDSNSDGQTDTMQQMIAYGETAADLDARGDLVYGGDGSDDTIFGGKGGVPAGRIEYFYRKNSMTSIEKRIDRKALIR